MKRLTPGVWGKRIAQAGLKLAKAKPGPEYNRLLERLGSLLVRRVHSLPASGRAAILRQDEAKIMTAARSMAARASTASEKARATRIVDGVARVLAVQD